MHAKHLSMICSLLCFSPLYLAGAPAAATLPEGVTEQQYYLRTRRDEKSRKEYERYQEAKRRENIRIRTPDEKQATLQNDPELRKEWEKAIIGNQRARVAEIEQEQRWRPLSRRQILDERDRLLKQREAAAQFVQDGAADVDPEIIADTQIAFDALLLKGDRPEIREFEKENGLEPLSEDALSEAILQRQTAARQKKQRDLAQNPKLRQLYAATLRGNDYEAMQMLEAEFSWLPMSEEEFTQEAETLKNPAK